MIKATISNTTKREAFAKANARKIASGTCETKAAKRGLVLDTYKLLASGTCLERKVSTNELNNIVLFAKQKEVA